MSAWKVPTYHAEMSDDSSHLKQADHRVFIRAEKAETAKKQPRNKKRSSKEITRKLHRTNKKKSRKEISYD